MFVIKYVKLSNDAKEPFRAHPDDAGADLVATSCEYNKKYHIWEYGTGLAMKIPSGYYGDLRPRSSIYKTGLILCNSCGTLDSSYTGEVMAKFYEAHLYEKDIYNVGDRIIQIVIPGVDPREIIFEEVESLEETERGNGGFGSSGK